MLLHSSPLRSLQATGGQAPYRLLYGLLGSRWENKYRVFWEGSCLQGARPEGNVEVKIAFRGVLDLAWGL